MWNTPSAIGNNSNSMRGPQPSFYRFLLVWPWTALKSSKCFVVAKDVSPFNSSYWRYVYHPARRPPVTLSLSAPETESCPDLEIKAEQNVPKGILLLKNNRVPVFQKPYKYVRKSANSGKNWALKGKPINRNKKQILYLYFFFPGPHLPCATNF